jgi:hypothetical protein
LTSPKTHSPEAAWTSRNQAASCSAAAARAYVEADHSRADDYYLAEGSGVAERYDVMLRNVGSATECKVARAGPMDGATYERWVTGYDVDTGSAKGLISEADNALRMVEVVVNGPKTWSIAASLHPEIAAAYDAAQERAAVEIIAWLAAHSTTRAGPRDRQVQVPVERGFEAAVIQHYTSRAGDPHRHLHLQINAKVFAKGKWRAPLGRHPRQHRGDQRHRSRGGHVQSRVPRGSGRPGYTLNLGSRQPTQSRQLAPTAVGRLRRDVAVDLILTRLGSKRSAWNAADIRGEAEKLIASVGIVADRAARVELAEDLTARAARECRALRERTDVPDHIRNPTSDRVLAVEAELLDSLATRSMGAVKHAARVDGTDHLDIAQRKVVAALAGEAGLLVIEGAAGTGKTTTLAAARDVLDAHDRRLVVVTPTLKAAQAARQQVGTDAFSAAWLIHQHGFRWDEDGRWSQVDASPDARARLLPGDVLLVDEAGMLDQDTARALFAIADRAHATIALLGDRHQLPAVGRGGVLDLAARWVRPEAHLELESVHRFADPAYADLSLLMRGGERPSEVFDDLVARGEIVVHPSEVERADALADIGAAGRRSVIGPLGSRATNRSRVFRRSRPGSKERSVPSTRRVA